MARIGLAGLAVLIMVLPVLAASSSSSYAWDMPRDGRYVNGKQNGVTHSLSAGKLSNSGRLWQYATIGGATGPLSITVEVWKDNILSDTKICSITVPTSSTIGVQSGYSVPCGDIAAGNYYLVIWKAEKDGWSTQGDGTLETR